MAIGENIAVILLCLRILQGMRPKPLIECLVQKHEWRPGPLGKDNIV